MNASQSHPSTDAKSARTEAEPSAAFTPGPWVCEPGLACIWIGQGKAAGPSPLTGVHKVGRVAATVDGGPYSGYRASYVAEQAANARLIAAAPDLLEALQDLVLLEGGRFGTGVIKPGTYGAAVMNAARDAIAKAVGTSALGTSQLAEQATPQGNSGRDQ